MNVRKVNRLLESVKSELREGGYDWAEATRQRKKHMDSLRKRLGIRIGDGSDKELEGLVQQGAEKFGAGDKDVLALTNMQHASHMMSRYS